jgi:hypothetical protein
VRFCDARDHLAYRDGRSITWDIGRLRTRPALRQFFYAIPMTMEDSMIPQDMIPQEKSAAVTRGLREAFGVTAFEDICVITRSLTSALIFRIVVRRSPFLLRVITRTDAMNDPARQFTCMKAAAKQVWRRMSGTPA